VMVRRSSVVEVLGVRILVMFGAGT
jgi:hypothetical protein